MSFIKDFKGHMDTILPIALRFSLLKTPYTRERITIPKDDFIDLDWIINNNTKLVIISYGLESHSQSPYIKKMVKKLSAENFDILVWNYRSCSGEINKTHKLYHSGISDELNVVVEHVRKNYSYQDLSLVGFSMGGNITLKYLGEMGENIPSEIKSSCVFSVPCDLSQVSDNLKVGFGKVYLKSFLNSLTKKVKLKEETIKDFVSPNLDVRKLKSLEEFDEKVTAPLHNFSGAKDYYNQSSSKTFIPSIKVKTLIINAKNDPFLSGECYPQSQVRDNSLVTLETPAFGGHIGFIKYFSRDFFWAEKRLISFLKATRH